MLYLPSSHLSSLIKSSSLVRGNRLFPSIHPKKAKIGRRDFSMAVPTEWNRLPNNYKIPTGHLRFQEPTQDIPVQIGIPTTIHIPHPPPLAFWVRTSAWFWTIAYFYSSTLESLHQLCAILIFPLLLHYFFIVYLYNRESLIPLSNVMLKFNKIFILGWTGY